MGVLRAKEVVAPVHWIVNRRHNLMKSISVIIPVLNEEKSLPKCLSALQCLRNRHLEIIVVDGGSTDRTVEIAAPLADKLLLASRGRANQMNVGAGIARGEVFLFLHGDTMMSENCLQELQTRFSGEDICWGWFNLQFSSHAPFLTLVSKLMRARSNLTGISTGDQTLFVGAQLFNAIKGFPNIPLMEDIALCKRLKKYTSPLVLNNVVISSSRRWEKNGILRTIFLMWWLRFQYWVGVSPARLAASYYPSSSLLKNEEILVKHPYSFPHLSVLLFGRSPERGKVKKRLQSLIGADKALSLHKAMCRRMLQLLRNIAIAETQFWVTSDSNQDFLCSLSAGNSLIKQPDGNLGDKMLFAISQALGVPNKKGVLLIGCDCPAITATYLKEAASRLNQGAKLVLGPAEDGGYVLIGVDGVHPELFRDIDWGSERVFSQTVNNARALGIDCVTLEPLWDVDRPEDLIRLKELSPPLDW